MRLGKFYIPLAIICATCGGLEPVTGRRGTAEEPAILAAAQRLTMDGDIASHMLDGIDRFLQAKNIEAVEKRAPFWQRNFSSIAAYQQSLKPNRQRLEKMLGIVEQRIAPVQVDSMELVACADNALAAVVTNPGQEGFRISRVRWPVLSDPDPNRSLVSVSAEGLLLEPPPGVVPRADIILLADCDTSLVELCTERNGSADHPTWPAALAQLNCRVLMPLLINRHEQPRNGRAVLTNREFIYRSSFVLGRHVIGYDVQKVMSGIDWMQASDPSTVAESAEMPAKRPLGLVGLGEGGQIALFTAALDDRVDRLALCGSFGPMEQLWQAPIDRNVFGLLNEFGGAELLTMVAPRPVWLVHATVPTRQMNNSAGGAPGQIRSIALADAQQETQRARTLAQPWIDTAQWSISETNAWETSSAPSEPQRTTAIPNNVRELAKELLAIELQSGDMAQELAFELVKPIDESQMQQRAVEELDRHNQLLLRESSFVREQFMSQLQTNSLEAYQASLESYRDIFRDEIIGRFDEELLPLNARLRPLPGGEAWNAYEVVLDVFPDVIAYGVLLLPNDMSPDERRPVVVCQHGLEGRPADTFAGDHRAYHDFAARLCQQGYVVFAPQNPYLFKDRFRSLQRLANPLGKTLFSIIVPQHQQILNWLKTLPFVDSQRMGFYGLSYGGKSAMRIPALVTDYSLSICSADFNEWIVKNVSTRDSFSYIWTGEYEIFEWNLANTFNYAEMAALICPRPFMVERGHFDGVGTDSWVAFEYAKVRHLYAAQLNIADRTRIEWFAGPHTIHGQGTFDFLNQHLGPLKE
jgi:cephalosporin-C deacetylase-like acetyl esterase